MHSIMRNKVKFIALLLVVAALLNPGLNHGTVQAASRGAPASKSVAALPVSPCLGVGTGTVTCHLYAEAGSITMPDAAVVPTWGFSAVSGGPSELPGPMLSAAAGDSVAVTVTNNLTVAISVLFQGQSLVPDLAGIAPGGSKIYTFAATNPGTYLYEAGLLPNTQYQTAMGLHGALVVQSATAGQAYADASTAFNDEFLVVLSEFDPALNNSVDPSAFDMRDFAPKYHLINGKAYPDTANLDSAPGNTVLLRYINASVSQHSMALLGPGQRVIAYDGSPLAYAHNMVAETFGPGQTVDVLVDVPASAVLGTMYPLYDGNLFLVNSSSAGYGGMLTFLVAGVAVPPVLDTLGPETSSFTLSPNPTAGTVNVNLSASVSDVNTGGANIAAAEYYIDSTAGTAVSLAGAFGSPTVPVSGTISSATLSGLAIGNHLVYVRGQDAIGNWGEFNFVTLNLDLEGPATTGLLLTPNPSNGSMDVALTATGDDRYTGNSNIIAGEYTLNGGGAVAMDVNMAAPIASLDAVIPAATVDALLEGTYPVTVRSQDAYNRWGAVSNTTLMVDKTAPSPTSNLSANPNFTNGKQGFSINTPAIRVIATFEDLLSGGVQSKIAVIEGFIDTIGANGSGFKLIPSDGIFNTWSETGYVDVPLSTIIVLSDGVHTIFMHAKDSSGNWSDANAAPISLTIDKSGPAVSAVTVVPNPTNGLTTVTLTANAADTVSNIAAAEWFAGTDPGQGNATVMTINTPASLATGLTAAINVSTWTQGTYTLSVRARDAAGNWSLLGSTVLIIDKNGPAVSSVSATPNPTRGAPIVTLTANAADTLTNIVAAEWFTGADPGQGSGNAMTINTPASLASGLTATINVSSWTLGNHTLYVRARDAVGNWSVLGSTALRVTRATFLPLIIR